MPLPSVPATIGTPALRIATTYSTMWLKLAITSARVVPSGSGIGPDLKPRSTEGGRVPTNAVYSGATLPASDVSTPSTTTKVGSTTICLSLSVAITVLVGSALKSTSLKYRPGPVIRSVVFDLATTSSGIACMVAK